MARGSACSNSTWTCRISSRPFGAIYGDVSNFKKWKRGPGIYLIQCYSTRLAFQRAPSQSPVLKEREKNSGRESSLPHWRTEYILSPQKAFCLERRKDCRQLFPTCLLLSQSAGVCRGQAVQVVGSREHYLFFDPRNVMWVDLKVCLFFKGLISSLRTWVK